MSKNLRAIIFFVSVVLMSQVSLAKVYKNIRVGKYQQSYDLRNNKNQSFLGFMKNEIFPALNEQANKQSAFDHITGVQKGEGVEIRLTGDVSTYHVKYKAYGEDKAERSGRSFSAVGKGSRVAYVADASYKHYLTSLDRYLKRSDEEIRHFYKAILEIIVKSDSSSVDLLSTEGKEVLADFVAVYVAEQYRHMMSGDGQGSLGKNHNWDDAHLQVTLLAAFHGGQSTSQKGMFYEGKFTTDVYPQMNNVNDVSLCLYRGHGIEARNYIQKRRMNLTDYWQFNRACERSGVNLTRRDFTAMGKAITSYMKSSRPELVSDLNKALGLKYSSNAISDIGRFLISNNVPQSYGKTGDLIVESILEFLLHSNLSADQITLDILSRQESVR